MNNAPYIGRHSRARGVALLLVVLLCMIASLVVTLGIGRTVYHDVLRYRDTELSKQAFFTAEALLEDLVHRHRAGKLVSNNETISLNGATAAATVSTGFNQKTLSVVGTANGRVRATHALLNIGNGASFNFGLQSGNGGITLQNSSAVHGNVYSDGGITGAGGNMIRGDAVASGPTGLITGIHATGSVYAHSVTSATVDKNVYYAGAVSPPPGVTVGGTTFTNSPDQEPQEFPIDDDLIDEWKAEAEAGGVILATDPLCAGGTYTVNSDTSLGPLKIECNLLIDKPSTELTMTGPLWVAGNLDTKSGPSVKIDDSFVDRSLALIVDNPSNRLTSSRIILDQGASFDGGLGESYVLLVSQNNSAENGGTEIAIGANQSVIGDVLFYASHGLIQLEQSANLKEVTGYKILLKNTAIVTYESGLASVLFGGGPGGGYTISSWGEVE